MISRLARFLLIIVPLLGIFFSAPVASAHYRHWRHPYHHHWYWRHHAYRPRYYSERDWYAYPRRYRYERYSRVYPYNYYGYRGYRDD